MSEKELNDLEQFLKSEMLMLNIKSLILKKASRHFKTPQDEIKRSYYEVRGKITREALNRGIVYLLLSSIFFFVGIKSVQGNSQFIYLGGLLIGSGGILTSIGYFILAIKGNSKQNKK